MKKLLVSFVLLALSSVVFGAPGDVLFHEGWEYEDQAALQAAGWSELSFLTTGDLPVVTTELKTQGEKSLKAEWGFAGKRIFDSRTTNVELSVQWYYDPAGGYDSYSSGIWLEQSDGSTEQGQLALHLGHGAGGIARNELGVSKWPGTANYSTGLLFDVGWNEVKATIDADGWMSVSVNGEFAADTYGGPGHWDGVQFVWLGQWWGPVEGEQVAFDELTFTEIPEPTTIALLGVGGLALIRRKRA